MKRLLVTGSREWTDRNVILDALTQARDAWVIYGVTLVHGDARGADRIAAAIAEQWVDGWAWQVEPHPADWSMGRSAGPRRNAEMVALGADFCFAFILDHSAGAEGCARLARKAGISVRTFRASSAVSS